MIRLPFELQSQQEEEEDGAGGLSLKIAFVFGKLETYTEVDIAASMVENNQDLLEKSQLFLTISLLKNKMSL